MNDETQALSPQEIDDLKPRVNGYCPHCKTVHVLKLWTQTYPAKYNKAAKQFADCTNCGNTFFHPATEPYTKEG